MKIRLLFASSAFLCNFSSFAGDVEVIQKDKTFDKTSLELKVGESISFVNNDTVTHNVFSNSPDIKFDLKTQKPGETSKIKFDKAGTGEVRCAIHPGMKIAVTVK